MLAQNLDKIRRLMEQSPHSIPEILPRFYSFARMLAARVKEESAGYDTTTLYSSLLTFYKQVIQD